MSGGIGIFRIERKKGSAPSSVKILRDDRNLVSDRRLLERRDLLGLLWGEQGIDNPNTVRGFLLGKVQEVAVGWR